MDLRKLAGFYDEHSRQCQRSLRQYCSAREVPIPDGYLDAVMPYLMEKLFDITHKVLLGHYRTISAQVALMTSAAP